MIEPSPDLPEFINRVIQFRRDYEALCRRIAEGEKILPQPDWIDRDGNVLKVDGPTYRGTFRWITPLTSGKRGPAFEAEADVDDPMLPLRDCPEELIRLEQFVSKAKTLANLGVYQIAEFKLFSRCTRHGYITTNVTTTDIEPNVGSFRCLSCQTEGITKWPPVTLVERVGGGSE